MVGLNPLAPRSGSRSWDVLLIGGASGIGKTTITKMLASHFGVNIVEVDDFQALLEGMTTPQQFPALHFWRSHPDPKSLSPERIVQQLITISEVMRPGLDAVIANHLDSNIPMILEGDFILPALAAQSTYGEIQNAGRVRGIFLIESDEAQIVGNYAAREPEAGDQSGRAYVSRLYGDWLKAEAGKIGVPALDVRPFDTLFERIINAIR